MSNPDHIYLSGWRTCQTWTDPAWFWTQVALVVMQAAAMGQLEDTEVWSLDNELARWAGEGGRE